MIYVIDVYHFLILLVMIQYTHQTFSFFRFTPLCIYSSLILALMFEILLMLSGGSSTAVAFYNLLILQSSSDLCISGGLGQQSGC